jgi:hypothetical protein
MDRYMDRLGKMNSLTLSPFFRADRRRAIDGVIAYFGDSLASASPPATLAFRGAAGGKTSQPLMPWLDNEVMRCRMAPCCPANFPFRCTSAARPKTIGRRLLRNEKEITNGQIHPA